MKSSTKKKEEVKATKKSSVKNKVEEKKLTEQDQVLLTLWEEEVRGLLESNFENFDDAIEAVIEGVINKVDSLSKNRDATRNFLYQFMTTDPEIVEELKNIFKLK